MTFPCFYCRKETEPNWVEESPRTVTIAGVEKRLFRICCEACYQKGKS